MSDTEMIDWLESVGGQVWPDRERRNWTAQVIRPPPNGKVIQPTRATLRAAINDAHAQYWEHQTAELL